MLPASEIPDELKHELYGEEIRFSLREPRLISKDGTAGGYLFGTLVLIGGIVLWAKRGDPDLTVAAFGLEIGGATATGQTLLTVLAALVTLAGVVLIAVSPVLRAMPGGVVVGTPTRLLRSGRFGVRTARWRDFKTAKASDDGTIHLERYEMGPRPSGMLTQIVEAPDGKLLVETIKGLIREAVAHPPAARRGSFRFTAARLPGYQGHIALYAVGALFAFFGLGIVGAILPGLLQGKTMTLTVDGGSPQEIGIGHFMSWVPIVLGLLFAALGVVPILFTLSRRRRVEYELSEEGLTLRPEGGQPTTHPWRDFTGEMSRRNGRSGANFRLPMRTSTGKRGNGAQAVLRILAVPNGDEVEAELRARLL